MKKIIIIVVLLFPLIGESRPTRKVTFPTPSPSPTVSISPSPSTSPSPSPSIDCNYME